MDRNSCDIVSPRQVRKIGPTRRSISGVYAFRGETPIPFESTLERDFLIKAEFALSVADVVAQPVAIPFVGSNGQTYTYTPDFLVYYRLGQKGFEDYPHPLLVEVKPKTVWKRNRQDWKRKWRAAFRYAKDQGWDFRIFDESRIRDQAMENIRFLERYKRMVFPEAESAWLLDSLHATNGAPFHLAITRHFIGDERAVGISHLWHLVAMRRLDCDISSPLGDFTELWIPTHGH